MSGPADLISLAEQGREVDLAAALATGANHINKKNWMNWYALDGAPSSALFRLISKLFRTALHEASREGHLGCVKLLLQAGAATNVADASGVTPLHQAVFRGHVAIVSALINAGAPVNVADYTGATPLHEAATKNRKELLPVLLHAGASVTATNKQRRTPLMLASEPEVKRILKGTKYAVPCLGGRRA